MTSAVPTMCYASSAREYRAQMGGAPDAAQLPAPTDEGIEKWENARKFFEELVTDIGDALIEQVGNQKETFNTLPAEGDKLENGRNVILDPPQKGWVENGGWDKTFYLGWASDYEERQADFTSTNERANAAMERYQGQTEGVIARIPEFKPVEQPPPPPVQPPGSGMQSADSHMAGAGMSSPAGTSSSWAGSSPSGGSVPQAPAPSQAPASSGSAWANPSTPPGAMRGPDGTLYRQGPNGWERQNPYNGRWAPSPHGGPGGAGGARGAGGGAGGARGGGMGGRAGAGAGAGGQLGAGGRAGAGGLGAGAAAGGSASGGAAGGGRGGAPMGGAGGGARGGQQQGDEEEHARPSWLTEVEDVFTNDLDRVAPPVFGE